MGDGRAIEAIVREPRNFIKLWMERLQEMEMESNREEEEGA